MADYTFNWTAGVWASDSYDEWGWDPRGTYSGTLPPGISITSYGFDEAGEVGYVWFGGTPTTAGTYTITLYAYTSGGNRTIQFNIASPSATVSVNVNGSWVKGTVYVNVNGSWVKAKKIYTKVNGSWVEGH